MAELRQAACGLDCNSCNLYLAAHDLRAAAALVDWFRARSWIGEHDGPEAVQAQAPFCMGCWDVTPSSGAATVICGPAARKTPTATAANVRAFPARNTGNGRWDRRTIRQRWNIC